jgi:hypothetical protein
MLIPKVYKGNHKIFRFPAKLPGVIGFPLFEFQKLFGDFLIQVKVFSSPPVYPISKA